MSDYGKNFGFLRSSEELRVAEGRFKTPAGSSLKLGSVVEIDPAAPGFVKQSATNAALVTGFSGLLLQEQDWNRSIYETDIVDSLQKGTAKGGQQTVITSGAGVKFWVKNTAASTRADGRSVSAVTMATLTGVVVGDTLSWDGSKFVKTGVASTTIAIAKVTAVNVAAGYVEAVLLG